MPLCITRIPLDCCNVLPLPLDCRNVLPLPLDCCNVLPLPLDCCNVLPLPLDCCNVLPLPLDCCNVLPLPLDCCNVLPLLCRSLIKELFRLRDIAAKMEAHRLTAHHSTRLLSVCGGNSTTKSKPPGAKWAPG
jgi:hypothetical protein